MGPAAYDDFVIWNVLFRIGKVSTSIFQLPNIIIEPIEKIEKIELSKNITFAQDNPKQYHDSVFMT